MEDGEWAKLMAEGNESAKARFVMTFHGPLYRWLRYLTADVDAAQELTQDTFVEALQAVARYEGRASLSTWVHRIAYYRYTHWLREQRRDARWRAPIEDAESCADPECDAQWDSIWLRQALAELSEEHRDTFVLHYIQQLSVSEVAAVLAVPPGTVQSRLFHARKRLRDLLCEESSAPAARGRSSRTGAARPADRNNVHEVIIR